MESAPLILSDSIDLIAEVVTYAERLGLEVHAEVKLLNQTGEELPQDLEVMLQGASLLGLEATPEPALLLAASRLVPVPLIFHPGASAETRMLAEEFGLAVVAEPDAATAALRLRSLSPGRDAKRAVEPLSARALSAYQRRRLSQSGLSFSREGPRLIAIDPASLAIEAPHEDEAPVQLGSLDAVRRALESLSTLDARAKLKMPHVEGADRHTVEEILLGPPRVLSDPASKAALEAYGIKLPEEELCASPSRAAAEAQRIGFPVRLSLASPDLRPSDHPDLLIDGIGNAARVREAYRELQALATLRDPDARILGVTVSASTLARALLSAELRILADDRVLVRLGLSSLSAAHPLEETLIVLPTHPAALLRSMERLRGVALILGESPSEKRHLLSELAELLYRLASLLRDFETELVRIKLPRLAVLESGELEVREALVEIGDVFSRQLA